MSRSSRRSAGGSISPWSSICRRGDCRDNAVAESFFATLEKELLAGAPLRSPAGMTRALVEFVDGRHNRERLHSSLDFRTPVAFEQDLLRTTRVA
jgi:transposase InsO family protein